MDKQTDRALSVPVSQRRLTKLVTYLSKVVDWVSSKGVYIGAAALVAMMFLTFFDVIGRLLGGISFINNIIPFFRPISGGLEISSYAMGILVSFGLVYMAFKKGHIRVDFILTYTSKKVTKWIDLFTYGISCGFYVLLTWQIWVNAIKVFHNQLSSPVLLIPTYPFIFILVICAASMVLVFLRDFLNSLDEVMK